VAFEDQTNQPCVFGNGTTGYDQLQFGVGTNDPDGFLTDYNDYYFAMDVVIGTLVNDTFVIHFDAPTVNRLDFESNGTIQEAASGSVIGSWTTGTSVLVQIHFDLVNAIWEISLDGSPAYNGPVSTDGRLRAIRLHLGGANVANGVAADNFLLYGGLPPNSVEESEVLSAFGPGWTLSPHPNPATDGATIRWATTGPTQVLVEISNVSGRRVWVQQVTRGQAGFDSMRWDGTETDGGPLPSGTYFIRISAGDRILGTEKIILRR
jgi:hypothetical protein